MNALREALEKAISWAELKRVPPQDIVFGWKATLGLAAQHLKREQEPAVQPCFTCEGESGQPATQSVMICTQCFGDEMAAQPPQELEGLREALDAIETCIGSTNPSNIGLMKAAIAVQIDAARAALTRGEVGR